MVNQPAILVLADGLILKGFSIGAPGESVGELVFNTSMTGYQEILTDPSYTKQTITLTAAHIGNTGCNNEDLESSRIWASGLVLRNYAAVPSSYRSQKTLSEWLKKNHIQAIAGIDTRYLTQYLRDNGAQAACISTAVNNSEEALAKAQAFPGLQGMDLAAEVSRKTIQRWHEDRGIWSTDPMPQTYHVVAYDFGIKHTILRILYEKGCHITLVPAKTSYEEVMGLQPDGVFLSNGPGDPAVCDYAIQATKAFLEADIPLFGICLGFQILGLALGATSIKMKFGHHGANHPVVEVQDPKRVLITSQNHGFAIDEASLPHCLEVTHRSLFDHTLQGIQHKTKWAYGFQGHPEASPGPHDSELLFTPFLKMMAQRKNNLKRT